MSDHNGGTAATPLACNQGNGHEWVVFSTALTEGWLLAQCVECGRHGTIRQPSKPEWEEAFHASSRPYRWLDQSRVHLEGVGPRKQFYVVRKLTGKRCECHKQLGVIEPMEYERMPAEIVRHDDPVVTEDRETLAELADFVKTTDLCSRMFPVFVEGYQKDTGHTFPESVLSIARRIDTIDAKGLHCSPGVVARVLWEYADWEPGKKEGHG